MITLKCKFCGGDLVAAGESLVRCDSCDTLVTIPKINEEKVARMYDRGNHFRQVGDFDRAYQAYEQVLAENPYDAEAHWCLVLCRFGIEYVKDARSFRYLPTLSRMHYTSILEDPDYLAALKYSDEETAEVYRKEARKIALIWERYIKIAKTEDPYDVFICFKAEDEKGRRTKGSVKAQELYEMLTQKGLKVFFSRITLEDKLTEEYEPYIFAALQSAKVMLVVADQKEHLQARWVKNEWMRYLSMMDEDRSRHMIPVYVDLEPEDFPREIPKVQGKKTSEVGALPIIVSNVMELTGRRKNVVLIQSEEKSLDVANILKRVCMDMEDGDFAAARNRIRQLLAENPEHAQLQYYQFLIDKEVVDADKLLDKGYDWDCDVDFLRVFAIVEGEEKQKLQKVLDLCTVEKTYRDAIARKKEENFKEARKMFLSIQTYRDAKDQAEDCIRLLRAKEERQRREVQQKRAMVEYRKEVGDTSTYIRRKIQENHLQIYQKYQELHRRADKDTPEMKKWLVFWSLLFCALAVFMCYKQSAVGFSLTEELSELFLGCCMGCSLFTLICLYVRFDWDIEDISWWLYVVLFFVFYMGYALAPLATTFQNVIEFSQEAQERFYIVGAAVPLLVSVLFLYSSLKPMWKQRRNQAAKEQLLAYQEKYVKPLEEQYRKEINQKYEPLVGKDHLLYLPGI